MTKTPRPTIPELQTPGWNLILEGYRGSISHGTYVPTNTGIDDKDIIGVVIPPIRYFLGFDRFEQIERKIEEWDIVIYEVRKFVRMLAGCNPNVISLLWLEPNHYTKITSLGRLLIDNRHLFLSKAVHRTFSGYAYGQLKRMEHYDTGKAFKGYMGAKRKALVEKFSFDVKCAGHLIRLLRMGIEILSMGEVRVMRPEAPHLIEIKQGKYSLEDVKKEADHLFKMMDVALVRSDLPANVNQKAVAALLQELLFTHFDMSEAYGEMLPEDNEFGLNLSAVVG